MEYSLLKKRSHDSPAPITADHVSIIMLEVTYTAGDWIVHVVILRGQGAADRMVDIVELSRGHLRDPWNVFHIYVSVHLGCQRRLVTAAGVAQAR